MDRRLIKQAVNNSTYFLMGSVISGLIGILGTALLARYLLIQNFGIFNLFFVYLAFAVQVTDFGMPKILVRELASQEKMRGALMGTSIVIKLVLAAAVTPITFLLLANTKLGTLRPLIYLISCVGVLFSIDSIVKTIFEAEIMQKYKMGIEIITKLIYTTLIFLASLFGWSFGTVLLIAAYQSLISIFLCVYISKKLFTYKLAFDYKIAVSLLRMSSPQFLTGIFTILCIKADAIIISKVLPNPAEAVGLYSAAVRLIEIWLFLFASVLVTSYPLMSRFNKNTEEMFKIFMATVKYYIVIAIPLFCLVLFFNKDFLQLLYGEKYIPAWGTARILSFLLISEAISVPVAQALIVRKKQHIITLVMGIAAIFNIILNLYIIPVKGISGAAIVWVITSLLIMVLNILFLGHYAKELIMRIKILEVLKLIFLTVSVLLLFKFLAACGLFIAVGIMALLYPLILVVFKFIDVKEIRLIFNRNPSI